MNLDFIPIGEEEYDFAIPVKYLETDMIQAFIKTIQSEGFKKTIRNMGGYGIEDIGKVVRISS